jgi:hypothetical protein
MSPRKGVWKSVHKTYPPRNIMNATIASMDHFRRIAVVTYRAEAGQIEIDPEALSISAMRAWRAS